MRGIRSLLLFVSGAGFLLCLALIGGYYWHLSKADKGFEVMVKQREVVRNEQSIQSVEASEAVEEKVLPTYYENKDCVGWIEIANTKVNYPVMQHATKEEYYLHRNFEGDYSYSGTPFLDARCILGDKSQNQIIYAHNMNDGSMFGTLKNYTSKSFLKEHPMIILETSETTRDYTIFAVLQSSDGEDTYRLRDNLNPTTAVAYTSFVEALEKQSLYETDVVVDATKQLLVLVTCTSRANTKGRIIIAAYENTP